MSQDHPEPERRPGKIPDAGRVDPHRVAGACQSELPERIRRMCAAWKEGDGEELLRLAEYLRLTRDEPGAISEGALALEGAIREALGARRGCQTQEVRARLEELISICERAAGGVD